MIAAAGVWAALLIVARLFDRPLGQNLLALVCAAILVAAGVRERAKRPRTTCPGGQAAPAAPPAPGPPPAPANGEAPTEPLPPPEFKPYKAEPGQQLHLGGDEEEASAPPDEA